MDDSGLPTSSSSTTPAGSTTTSTLNELNALREQFESLRHLVVSLLVLAVVVTGTFDLFLWRQVRFLHSDRVQAEQMIGDYQKNRAPFMDEFVRRVVAYGQSNKDFAPIMMKYSLVKPAGTNAPPPPGANPTAPPMPSQKK